MRTFYKLTINAESNDCWTSGYTSAYNFADATEADAVWFEDDCFTSGDYCGNGTVGRSNVRVIRDEFADLDGIAFHVCHGSHGSEWIRFDIACLALPGERYQELRDVLDKLDDYPLISDDDLSDLECSDEDEAWNDVGANDMRSALGKASEHHNREFFDCIPDDALHAIWRMMSDKWNINGGSGVTHEQGGCYFHFDEIVKPYHHLQPRPWSDIRAMILAGIAEYRTYAR